MKLEQVTEKVIGAALEVHRRIGPGLIEAVYDVCFAHEMAARSLTFERQVWLPLIYRGQRLDHALRLDFLVEREVIVEVKTVDRVEAAHEAQLVSYLRLANKPVGLLINFHAAKLKDGLRRKVWETQAASVSLEDSGALVSWE